MPIAGSGISISSCGPRARAPRRSGRAPVGGSRSGGSGRRSSAGPCAPRSWPARRRRARRLLERLQERVPGRVREHVRLVEDVHASPPPIGASATFSRSSRMSSTELFDAASISTTSSDCAGHDRSRARVVRPRSRRAARSPRSVRTRGAWPSGLAGAARADEQVRVVDLAELDRVAEGPHDVLLADHLVERARAVATVEREHRRVSS